MERASEAYQQSVRPNRTAGARGKAASPGHILGQLDHNDGTMANLLWMFGGGAAALALLGALIWIAVTNARAPHPAGREAVAPVALAPTSPAPPLRGPRARALPVVASAAGMARARANAEAARIDPPGGFEEPDAPRTMVVPDQTVRTVHVWSRPRHPGGARHVAAHRPSHAPHAPPHSAAPPAHAAAAQDADGTTPEPDADVALISALRKAASE